MRQSSEVSIASPVLINRREPKNLQPEDGGLFQDALQYSTRQVFLKPYGKVWVSPDSVVYKNGQLKVETVVVDSQISYYRFRHLVKMCLISKKINLGAKRNHLLVTDAWSTGHFHWFMDALPKIWLIRYWSNEFVLLLPDHEYVRTIGLESLGLLNIKFQDIVLMKKGEFYKVPHLYFVSRIAPSGQVNDNVMREMNEAFVGTKDLGNDRIYISRSKATLRKVVNEDELVPVLKEHGFEIVYGEDYALTEQVDIFSKASTILGLHGAGLTNCMFMKPGGNVIELCKGESNHGYWHLSDSLGHKYYYYHGVPDSDRSLIGRDPTNLTVPVNDFEQKILSRI